MRTGPALAISNASSKLLAMANSTFLRFRPGPAPAWRRKKSDSEKHEELKRDDVDNQLGWVYPSVLRARKRKCVL